MAATNFPAFIDRNSGMDATRAIDIEAWTVEQAAERLQAARISPLPSTPSPPAARRRTVTLDIPLDGPSPSRDNATAAATAAVETHDTAFYPIYKKEAVHVVHKRREPVRRDSLKSREALLKGKEGSRRRQRWENDRLLNNPHAQPPLPSDWEVRPTYPVHSVPYFLAPLWDAEFKYKASSTSKNNKSKAGEDPRAHGSQEDQAASRVPRELKAKLKKSRGAKNMLQDLEEEIRRFVESWEKKQKEMEEDGLIDADSEDEEIVFVGRNGAMSDERKKEKEAEHLRRDKLIFESLVDDHGAAFGYVVPILAIWSSLTKSYRRWLVHAIATYYGLETWSVTTGSPARREAYVGLRPNSPNRVQLPKPLWGMV